MKENKIQEIQILEQNLQNILFQKQSFQIEINEIQASLKELENSGEEVYKIIGQLMLRTEKQKVKKELLEKKEILEIHLKTVEKQEKNLTEKVEKLREELAK